MLRKFCKQGLHSVPTPDGRSKHSDRHECSDQRERACAAERPSVGRDRRRKVELPEFGLLTGAPDDRGASASAEQCSGLPVIFHELADGYAEARSPRPINENKPPPVASRQVLPLPPFAEEQPVRQTHRSQLLPQDRVVPLLLGCCRPWPGSREDCPLLVGVSGEIEDLLQADGPTLG